MAEQAIENVQKLVDKEAQSAWMLWLLCLDLTCNLFGQLSGRKRMRMKLKKRKIE